MLKKYDIGEIIISRAMFVNSRGCVYSVLCLYSVTWMTGFI